MTGRAKTALVGLLPVMIVILAGCETVDDLTTSITAKPPPCPRTTILSGASTVTKFKEGPGRDLIDVVSEGEILGFSGGCKYDIDDETGDGVLTVEISAKIAVKRGPADRSRKAALDYFVGITDKEQSVLNKEPFRIEVEFPGNRTVVKYIEDDPPVVLEIPLRGGQIGEDFKIIIGFQLSAEELEFNRHKINTGQAR